MATDNPKVSGYVPQAVYDQLMQFKTARGFNSVSLALTVLLQESFAHGRTSTPQISTTNDITTQRLDELEGK